MSTVWDGNDKQGHAPHVPGFFFLFAVSTCFIKVFWQITDKFEFFLHRQMTCSIKVLSTGSLIKRPIAIEIMLPSPPVSRLA